MQLTNSIAALMLAAVLTGCGGNKPATEDFLRVDVKANYPEKELILQDFMDVEYIPLATTDEFITRGIVKAIGKDMLLTVNRGNDGDIFVFDRSGNAIRKINRRGQSGEEYSGISAIILDEDNQEIYISDFPARKIKVYDLYGNFHRSFPFADTGYYHFLANYDPDHLIAYKGYSPQMENEQSCHLLISKQDGSVAREIQIPFKQVKTPVAIKEEMQVTPGFCLLSPCGNDWLLTRTSSDTIYRYTPQGMLLPFLVRTPSIQSIDPEVFLFPTVISDRYYFMQTLTKEFDFEKMKGFPVNELVYDKQENAVFEYTVYNADFSDKRDVYLGPNAANPVVKEVAAFESLEAPELREAYEQGKLRGKLKEIAAGLHEESNPVIMLIKHKK